MVKITQVFIVKHADELKCCPPRSKKASDKEFLRGITHLKLQSKFVDAVDSLPDCENVTSIYLQNNLLRNIPNLDSVKKLTHLYLQRNRISSFEIMGNFPCLKKLYLGYNELAVIEGLESLRTLNELHIQHQNLPLGETVHFDPRTVARLGESLEVLDVSGCGLTTLSPLCGMAHLKELRATENKLINLEEAKTVLLSLPNLQQISLKGNPITFYHSKYTDAMIQYGRSLQFLDDVKVSPITRNFIDGWKRVHTKEKGLPVTEKKKDISSKTSRPGKAVHFTSINNSFRSLPQMHNEDLAASFEYPAWALRKNVNATSKVPHRMYLSSHRCSDPKVPTSMDRFGTAGARNV